MRLLEASVVGLPGRELRYRERDVLVFLLCHARAGLVWTERWDTARDASLRQPRRRSFRGEVVKVKPAGTYSVGGEGEIHIEGGGRGQAIISFRMRSDTEVIYELLFGDLSL